MRSPRQTSAHANRLTHPWVRNPPGGVSNRRTGSPSARSLLFRVELILFELGQRRLVPGVLPAAVEARRASRAAAAASRSRLCAGPARRNRPAGSSPVRRRRRSSAGRTSASSPAWCSSSAMREQLPRRGRRDCSSPTCSSSSASASAWCRMISISSRSHAEAGACGSRAASRGGGAPRAAHRSRPPPAAATLQPRAQRFLANAKLPRQPHEHLLLANQRRARSRRRGQRRASVARIASTA